MTRTDYLAAEVTRAVGGDPWFGPALGELLRSVDARTAQTQVPGASHTIAEIVLHVGVWARYVAYRLGGGPPRDPEEGNWPSADQLDDTTWAAAVAALETAHEAVARALAEVPEERLDLVTEETPRDGKGQPVTLRRTVEGVAQHAAYHAGQIAVLKQVVDGGDS